MRRGRLVGECGSASNDSRAALASAAVAGLLSAVAVGLPAPAQAAGHPGHCTDEGGVTVVIDFNELGGGTVVRCAPTPLPGGGTGLDALQAAGIPHQGVARWGSAFICRIFGKPAPDQDIAIEGDHGYREACIDTPPATAYWSYWYAPNGGSWTYSQSGVKNREAIPGGFEGWSFSLNATATTNPPPDVVPIRPEAEPDPEPDPSDADPGGSDDDGSGGGVGSGHNGSDGAGGSGASNGSDDTNDSRNDGAGVGDGASSEGSGGETSDSRTPDTDGTTTAPGSPSPEPLTAQLLAGDRASPEQTRTGSEGTPADAVSVPAADGRDGSSIGTLVGWGALAFLVTVGAGTAWLRRTSQGARR